MTFCGLTNFYQLFCLFLVIMGIGVVIGYWLGHRAGFEYAGSWEDWQGRSSSKDNHPGI